MTTALTENLAASGAPIAEYAGARTATDFGDPRAEFAAITRSVGVYDLGWRAKIIVAGQDRVRWLNGMVTNNITDLPLNRGNYNFLLSPQGRIQSDLYSYNRGDHFLLDTERAQLPKLTQLLDHYIIMDDVELTDATEKLTSIGIQGPRATEILKQIGIEPSCADPLVVCDLQWNGTPISVTRMASEQYLTYEIWLAPERANSLWDALVSAGAKPVGTTALENFRVLAGVPKYGQDITERYIPQETNQKQALHFNKGCYVGQEIVERVHSRGLVHRGLTGFVLEGSAERGAKVIAADKEMGELTSVAHVPLASGDKWLALGYLRRDAGSPGAQVKIGDVSATVASLPFKF
jgi:folate-binding protein YgfZ